jgi:hypothetical protein
MMDCVPYANTAILPGVPRSGGGTLRSHPEPRLPVLRRPAGLATSCAYAVIFGGTLVQGNLPVLQGSILAVRIVSDFAIV